MPICILCSLHGSSVTISNVAILREVNPVHQFFLKLMSIINIVVAFRKCHDELQDAQAIEIVKMITIDDHEMGKEINQIGTLQRVRDTRLGSHFISICSLIWMYSSTCKFLQNIICDEYNYAQYSETHMMYLLLLSLFLFYI